MYVFKAFVFNGKRTAGKAFDTLEDRVPVYPWIEDAAVVSRSKLGITRIHSTWAQDDSAVGAGGRSSDGRLHGCHVRRRRRDRLR